VTVVNVAIVSMLSGKDATFDGWLARVTAAIQAQVLGDLYPAWKSQGVPSAVVAKYPRMSDAPGDALFVLLVEDAQGRAGLHIAPLKPGEQLGDRPSPRSYAVVEYREGLWPYTLSHEILEMIVDPGGNRTAPGPSPVDPAQSVDYLVEVCDPCQAISLVYPIAGFSDISLCNFCHPAYYGLETSTRFSHADGIDEAFSVARGGYLSFRTGSSWSKLTPDGVYDIPDDALMTIVEANFRGALDRGTSALELYSGPQHHLAKTHLRRAGLLSKGFRDGVVRKGSSAATVSRHAKKLGLI
jgi:hypothetical protein